MTTIKKATPADAALITKIASQSFIESHGHSASPEAIQQYVNDKYNLAVIETELLDEKNCYHLIFIEGIAAGYSKIVLNTPYENSPKANITKLERIYLLKAFYGMRAGSALFEHNIGYIKAANQEAVWLFVWKENERAIDFYKKLGFTIIGSYDFPISATHSNPNHQMLLRL